MISGFRETEKSVLFTSAVSSIYGRWMNEYGASVECHWQGKIGILGEQIHLTVKKDILIS
jgi:hypothetical protein